MADYIEREAAINVREKLVELLGNIYFPMMDGSNTVGEYTIPHKFKEKIADHLIANGVTVQEWISVKERLPQENEPEGTLCENVQVLLNNGKVSVGWCNRRTKLWWHMEYDEDYFISKDYDHTPVIAWQPLAQPPKGE